MKLYDLVKEKENKEVNKYEVKDGEGKVIEVVDKVVDSEIKVIDENKEVKVEDVEVTKPLDKDIFEKIKNIALSQGLVISNEKYFSFKGKSMLLINKSNLAPSKKILLSGKNFKEKYLRELEESVFSEKIEEDKLMEIIYLVSKIKNKKYPIGVKFNGFGRFEGSIIEVLNKFFNTHFRTLIMMYGMLDSELNKKEKVISENTNENVQDSL